MRRTDWRVMPMVCLPRKMRAAGIATALAALLMHPAIVFASAEFTRSHPIGNFQNLFSTDDYPSDALRNNVEGTVRYILNVAPDGSIAACTVASSSGSAELDAVTCDLLSKRARFEPARDENGQPVDSTYSGQMTWRIPKDAEGFQVRPFSVVVDFDVGADGTVKNCHARAVPELPATQNPCPNMSKVVFPDVAEAAKAGSHGRHVTFRNEVIISDIANSPAKR